jgi:hypothetical protein
LIHRDKAAWGSGCDNNYLYDWVRKYIETGNARKSVPAASHLIVLVKENRLTWNWQS